MLVCFFYVTVVAVVAMRANAIFRTRTVTIRLDLNDKFAEIVSAVGTQNHRAAIRRIVETTARNVCARSTRTAIAARNVCA